jgi:hypothetical protein
LLFFSLSPYIKLKIFGSRLIEYGTPILHVRSSNYSELKPKLAILEELQHCDHCYLLRQFAFYMITLFGIQRVIEDDDACGVEWQGSSRWHSRLQISAFVKKNCLLLTCLLVPSTSAI